MKSSDHSNVFCEESSCILCQEDAAELYDCGFDYQYWTTAQKFCFVRCVQCGHIYLNPRPALESAHVIYPSNYYTKTGRHTGKSSKIISLFKSYIVRRRLSFIKKDIGLSPSVLEVGCGDGALLLDLRKNFPKASLTGIDLTIPENLYQLAHDENIKIIEGSIENADIPRASYDLVIMNQLVEHLWDPMAALLKVYSSLRPGGLISIETPNVHSYDHRLFSNGTWGGFYFPRHLNLFDFKTLKVLLEKAGFEVVKQESLLAPIIWAFSFNALFSSRKRHRGWKSKFFNDQSPLCLALFTFIDIVAKFLGFQTSNQKVIARR